MPLYSYRGVTAAGRTERGTLSATSEKEARTLLRDRQVYPMSVRVTRPLRISLRRVLNLGRETGLSSRELANFARQMGTLLHATVPYDTALAMIQQETGNATLKAALADVRERVVEGSFMADAMAAYPRCFPPMMVNMVRAGEASGTLVLVMNRLADYFENAHRLRTRVTSALIYPAFMALFAFAVVTFMVAYIIPKLTVLFENFGAELPLPTRMLIALSGLISGYWWLVLGVVVLVAWGVDTFMRTEQGRALRDRAELRLPVWRALRRKLIQQRLAQTLGTLLASGVELKDALAVATDVVENRVYLRAMEHVSFEIQNRGLPLAVAVRRTGLFPEDICQMIAIGEETATLDTMLENVSNRLSYEITGTLEAATALFEPVMILVMGTVVGFIVISILLPMLQLNQLVGG